MTSRIAEHIPAAGVFMEASSNPEWYEHLKPSGSCLRLLYLLAEKRELIHQLGPKGITVLHKGVQHGCVRLVKFILVNMFDDEGSCTCRVHGPEYSRLTREQLLRKACEEGVTAVHMAVVSGSPKMVLLLKWALDKNELELKKKNSSSKDDQVTPSDATRVRLQRVRHGSTGSGLLFSGKEWDMKGKDMRRLFEAGNIEDSVPSELIPSEPCPPAVEEEMSINGAESYDLAVPDVKDDTVDCVYDTDSKESVEEERSINGAESYDLPVPDVKDDTIDCMYDTDSKESDLIPKVYDLIEHILEALDWAEPRMQECKKDVDFEFVPVAHVFLHFIYSRFQFYEILDDEDPVGVSSILLRIMRACKEHDLNEGNPQDNESMVATLFKILDPRGRTILHIAFETEGPTFILELFSWLKELGLFDAMSTESVRECVNSTDGAGRTILHLLCIRGAGNAHDLIKELDLNWDAVLSPLCEELAALESWCFPHYYGKRAQGSYRPIHLAIIFDSTSVFRTIYSFSKCRSDLFDMNEAFDFWNVEEMAPNKFNASPFNQFGPLQVAAFSGRATIVEEILREQPMANSIVDPGLAANTHNVLPAIHCAALSGQVEAIQSILKFRIYDPIIQDRSSISNKLSNFDSEGTALHLLLKRKNFYSYVETFQTLARIHVLPNSEYYARLKDEFSKLHFDEHEPQMFSANEISCINLLLQAGIDVWTPHCETGELPSPGPMANDKAREWWYNRVVNEVVTQKTSINNAANATSVIATLVATASFIGPLQPPLGLADDGYIYTSRIAVRVYLMCNGLSFYFSIASILMAVLPAIPMPKESLYDELFRSQRCLKAAALLLLVSIMCILTSFTSASIAVVSSERHDKVLVGAYIVVGGAVCVMVLVVYIIRLLRMVFHKNDRFRRWFAKHMIF